MKQVERAGLRATPIARRPWLYQRADGAVVTQLWKIAALKREQARAIAAHGLAVRRAMVHGL